ncbi:MAG: aspartate/glutamate racemase family protein [Desulfosarcinaceae bacterium]|nr:aspartate/glutamate racemase family protein [Desulfosarcinaceae bacterium]
MIYQNRDMRIDYARTRKNHTCYGMGLGIMVLDDAYPGFPGDVRNASAFPYPVQYEIAEGVDNYTLVWEPDKTPCREPILRAASKLERMGCRAIAAECGYFAYFQKDVAGHVAVPVFMSSLLQVPFIQHLIGADRSVAIVCAQKRFLSDTHLANVGIDLDSNFIVAGAQDEFGCPEFDNLWDHEKRPAVPEIYYQNAEADMVKICREVVRQHPGVGAIMLECTGMQPFARAVQQAVDLPVWSWGTLLDYAYSAVVHRDYYGHV